MTTTSCRNCQNSKLCKGLDSLKKFLASLHFLTYEAKNRILSSNENFLASSCTYFKALINIKEQCYTENKNLKDAIKDIEIQYIKEALKRNGNNNSKAALELGISRASLISKIKEYTCG